MMDYAKSKVLTSSGFVVERACAMSNFCVKPGSADTVVIFKDGGASGTTKWQSEGDSTVSADAQSFVPPLRFGTDLYVVIEQPGGANATVSVALVEPASSTDI